MSAPPLSAATSTPIPTVEPAPAWRTPWLIAAAILLMGWIGFLAALTFWTANQPVVNALQIRSARFVLVGRWKNFAAGEFKVERELKQGELQGTVIVTGVSTSGPLRNDAWVIPVDQDGKGYVVTQGKLKNQPLHPRPDVEPWPVDLKPQCYPATDDVLAQVDAVLNEAGK